jgi:hypothetical protein
MTIKRWLRSGERKIIKQHPTVNKSENRRRSLNIIKNSIYSNTIKISSLLHQNRIIVHIVVEDIYVTHSTLLARREIRRTIHFVRGTPRVLALRYGATLYFHSWNSVRRLEVSYDGIISWRGLRGNVGVCRRRELRQLLSELL